MAESELRTILPAAMPFGRGIAARSGRTSLNDALAWAVILFVALVPIPFGSSRPFFWAANAVAVGLVGLFYFIRMAQLGERLHHAIGRMPISAGLFVALCLFLVLQTLRLDQLPFVGNDLLPHLAFTTPGGAVISTNTISVTPEATWFMLLRWTTFGVLYFLVLQIAGSPRRRALLLNAALAIVAAYAVFGLASLTQFGDTILGMPKWAYQGVATATFVNRNSFATFLAFGAVLGVSLLIATLVRQSPPRGEVGAPFRLDPLAFVYLVALAAIVMALLATQSRMGAFSAVIGCLAVVAAGLHRIPGLWLRALILGLLTAIVITVAFLAFGQGLLDRLGSVQSSADVRVDLYRQVIDMIAARPFLGFGGGSFELAFPPFRRLPVSPDLAWEKAHNSYLTLWAELGLVAGSIPLILIALALTRIVGGLSKACSAWAAKSAGLGLIVVAALHSLTDFSLEIEANSILFVFVLAIAATSTDRAEANLASRE